MINFGKKPQDNLSNNINTANFAPLDTSGIFPLQIAQATHKKDISKKNGKPYEQIIINAVVLNIVTNEPLRSLSFSVYLSATSQELQDLLFFTKQFDAEGNIILDDYVEKRGTKKDGSGDYCIKEYKQFQGKKVVAMLRFTGYSDKGNPIFENLGFVSKTGQSAAEFNANLPASKHLNAWNAFCNNKQNYLDPDNNKTLARPDYVPPQKQQQQAQAYGQQYAQPVQQGYIQQGAPVYAAQTQTGYQQQPVQQMQQGYIQQPPVRQAPQGVVQQVQQMNALQGATVQKADDDIPF